MISGEQRAAATRQVTLGIDESESRSNFQQTAGQPLREVRHAVTETALQQRRNLVFL
jgi:hypothetical protein